LQFLANPVHFRLGAEAAGLAVALAEHAVDGEALEELLDCGALQARRGQCCYSALPLAVTVGIPIQLRKGAA
jgi:hypothetical protein